jgi:hypothetical protein
MRTIALSSAALLVCLFSTPAHAHISLERGGTQKSRYGDANIKEGPCGEADGARGSNIYTYEPGSTITVKLVEYVAHPGYFRFAFDQDGDDDFKDPASIVPLDPDRGCPASVLSSAQASRDQCAHSDFYNSPAVLPEMDNLDPHVMTEANKLWSFQVTLPDVECDNCTLQIIQVMEDPVHGPYNLEVSGSGDAGDVYHQCIDLVLKKGAGAPAADGGTSGSAGDAGAAGSKGAAAIGGSGAGAAGSKGSAASSGTAAPTTSSGCSVRLGAGADAPWAGCGVLGVVVFLRRLIRRARAVVTPNA